MEAFVKQEEIPLPPNWEQLMALDACSSDFLVQPPCRRLECRNEETEETQLGLRTRERGRREIDSLEDAERETLSDAMRLERGRREREDAERERTQRERGRRETTDAMTLRSIASSISVRCSTNQQ